MLLLESQNVSWSRLLEVVAGSEAVERALHMKLSMLEQIIHTQLSKKIMDQLAEVIRAYFRIDVEGLEHVPASGRALIIPNHSGFAGADAIMICHLIHHDLGRIPRILAHRAFFEWSERVRRISLSFGLKQASVEQGTKLLNDEELVVIFPEGESGNFKSTLKRYHLQPFHSGFMRMAIQTQTPLIPCLVTGAEESHLNLGSLNLGRYVKGLRLPVPLNLVPLPSKWKIRFLEPIPMDGYSAQQAANRTLVHDLCIEVQVRMQRELNQAIRKPQALAITPVASNAFTKIR